MDKFEIISKKWINVFVLAGILSTLLIPEPKLGQCTISILQTVTFSETVTSAYTSITAIYTACSPDTDTVSASATAALPDTAISSETSASSGPDSASDTEASLSAASQTASGSQTLPGFSISPITEEIKARILGISYPEGCPVPLDSLRYLTVLHTGFDGQTHQGELIVHQQIAETVLEIFLKLYLAGYPIEKIVLMDEYNADDEASMADNNTSAFCYRSVAGTDILSAHSYGLAVDINPLYNPCVSGETVSPAAALYDRESGSVFSPYFMTAGDYCVQLFLSRGFTWGGDWESPTDYQHFEYAVPVT